MSKMLALSSALTVFAILAALEGDSISCGQAIALAVPTYAVLQLSLDDLGEDELVDDE